MAHMGYCWKFIPDKMKTDLAEKICNNIGGHLITVNTKAKGRLLAKFLKGKVEVNALFVWCSMTF